MLTEYDIQRLSTAIVDNLVNDERFISRMGKVMPRNDQMINSTKAALLLGVTRKTICEIAPYIGGMKTGSDKRSRWMFKKDELLENYKKYKGKI